MTQQPDVAVLAEGGLRRVKEIRSILSQAGIEAHIARPPAAGNT